MLLQRIGLTFLLSAADSQEVERILPFYPLPGLISHGDW